MIRQLIILMALLSPIVATGQTKKGLQAFPLHDVRLLNGPFKHAEQTDINYILAMDVDRLLAPYLREAGLTPKAPVYTNWENTGLDGHIGGHYLSALSLMVASTGDSRMKDRMEYMIGELKRCQDNNGNGYLGGVPGGKEIWQQIENGKIEAGSFNLNKRWVPLYNIHKIYAGLRDAYLYGKSETAKEMLIKLTDWAIKLVNNLSEEQIQDMLRSEHGGLNEVFADVAAITGNPKYMKLAEQFSHHELLHPLMNHEDKLTGMHANTQIPKVIGFKRIADLNGNQSWESAVRYFWDNVVDKRSVVIGGNSVREHFHPTNDYSQMLASEQGPETCNTYNMLRLTAMLYLNNPLVNYIDYYERALYNHILSTQNPNHGGFVYFTPMRPGHYRVYSQPETSFWCCVGSGLENHAKYGEMIYAHDDNSLYVNLFIASKVQWKSKNIELIQETEFPESETTLLTINAAKSTKFTLFVRYPSWVKAGAMRVSVNGKSVKMEGQPSGYVAIARKWKKGDKVKVTLPMETRVEQIPDGTHYYAFLHGPVVLAAKTDTTDLKGLLADDSRGGHIATGRKIPSLELPIIKSDPSKLIEVIKPIDGKPLNFTVENLYHPTIQSLVLQPFYKLHDARYIIYWQSESAQGIKEIQQKQAQKEMEKLQLDARTVDMVFPGEQQPESDHFIESDRSSTGINNGKHYRVARGWFSYKLNDKKGEATAVRVMYFGADGYRHFKILLNNQLIATETLHELGDADFYYKDYTIPSEIAEQAKGVYTLKFEATDRSSTATVYEVRLVKP